MRFNHSYTPELDSISAPRKGPCRSRAHPTKNSLMKPEICRFRLALSDRDRGSRLRQRLLPRLHRVRPRGQTFEGVFPVGARHREERVPRDARIGAHPGMDVAADGHHHLRLGEGAFRLHPGERHSEVELVRPAPPRVHVVERIVAVPEGDRLAGTDPDHARDVFAPSLIDLDRLGRERIVALGKAFADPDERLRDLAARPDLHRSLARRLRVLPAFGWRAPRHAWRWRGGSDEPYDARDAAPPRFPRETHPRGGPRPLRSRQGGGAKE